MKINKPESRLHKFWGEVDKKHVRLIQNYVIGDKILDMGCGYGTTTFQITASGRLCIGIDYEQTAINEARKRFPSCEFQLANAEQLPFETGYFDCIILRDALHHFYCEANFEKVKAEILRVCKPKARIIFFDPNVNFLVKSMRKISLHVDEECNYETATQIMKELNFNIIYSGFNTLYSLPLSGGYVGLNFVPNIKFLYSIIISTENFFEIIIDKIGLSRYLCWRYMIVGER